MSSKPSSPSFRDPTTDTHHHHKPHHQSYHVQHRWSSIPALGQVHRVCAHLMRGGHPQASRRGRSCYRSPRSSHLPPSHSLLPAHLSPHLPCHPLQISPSTITPFLLSIPEPFYSRLSLSHGASSFPLQFPSPTSELNLLSLLALLNFGSAFRAPLHAFHGRGVYDTIRFFVLGCFLSSTDGEDLLGAKKMSKMGEGEVSQLMGGLPLMVEREHETMKGIVVGEKGGRLAELVGMVVGVMNETGRILEEGGWDNLGEFVKDVLEKAKGTDEERAEELVERLVRTFPAFQDMHVVDGERTFPSYLASLPLVNLDSFAQLVSRPHLQPSTSSRRRSSSSKPSLPDTLPLPLPLNPSPSPRTPSPSSPTTSSRPSSSTSASSHSPLRTRSHPSSLPSPPPTRTHSCPLLPPLRLGTKGRRRRLPLREDRSSTSKR